MHFTPQTALAIIVFATAALAAPAEVEARSVGTLTNAGLNSEWQEVTKRSNLDPVNAEISNLIATRDLPESVNEAIAGRDIPAAVGEESNQHAARSHADELNDNPKYIEARDVLEKRGRKTDALNRAAGGVAAAKSLYNEVRPSSWGSGASQGYSQPTGAQYDAEYPPLGSPRTYRRDLPEEVEAPIEARDILEDQDISKRGLGRKLLGATGEWLEEKSMGGNNGYPAAQGYGASGSATYGTQQGYTSKRSVSERGLGRKLLGATGEWLEEKSMGGNGGYSATQQYAPTTNYGAQQGYTSKRSVSFRA